MGRAGGTQCPTLETTDGARAFLSAATPEGSPALDIPTAAKLLQLAADSSGAPAILSAESSQPIAADKNVRATQGQERYCGQINFQRRLFQAFCGGHPGPLNQKAEAWWELSLNQLGDTVKQNFKLPTNPMKNPRLADGWEPYLHEKQKENTRLTRALADAEAELNDRVYSLFNLMAEEIKLLQKEVEH